MLSVLLCIASPAWAATTIFEDDFESGTLAAWGNCLVAEAPPPNINVVQSTTKHAGTFALKIDLKNSFGPNYTPCIHAPTPAPIGTRHYVSFWVNWGSTYACRSHWWRMRYGNGGQFDFSHDFRPCRVAQVNDVPEFIYGGGGSSGWTPADPFNVGGTINPYTPNIDGLWHRVEMLIYLNTPGVSDGTVKLWYDGVAAIDTDAGLNPGHFGSPAKQPRNTNTNFVDLEIMTNADINGYFDCTTRGGVQPCHSASADYFLYIDDVLWADDCPTTGATCSPDPIGGERLPAIFLATFLVVFLYRLSVAGVRRRAISISSFLSTAWHR